jgi:acyl-CoA thioester hydrolase
VSTPFPFDCADLVVPVRFRVRYAECDPMGVVHHANYLVYLEMGRIEALRAHGVAYRDLEAAGHLIVVSHLDLRFRAPARLDDELLLEVGLCKASRARVEHRYRLWVECDRVLCLEAHSTLACVDRAGRLQEMPGALLETVDPRVPGSR